MENSNHYVYMLECSDGSFYMGYAKNLVKRLDEHNSSIKGAKYTRGRRPVRLVYFEQFETRSDATKREYVLRKKSRAEKIDMMNVFNKKLD